MKTIDTEPNEAFALCHKKGIYFNLGTEFARLTDSPSQGSPMKFKVLSYDKAQPCDERPRPEYSNEVNAPAVL